MLDRSALGKYVNKIYSNEDVTQSKPHPEIYMRCMLDFGMSPRETLIVEDSHHGRRAAIESGAFLCAVENVQDVTESKITASIDESNMVLRTPLPWTDKNLNVLIPMAGAGKRFADAGYSFPKPLIEINGKPMIQLVVENINIDANYIFIVQGEHLARYNLDLVLQLISPGCKIIPIEGVTEGAAITTLQAEEFINNNQHLLIANSDQLVEWSSSKFMSSMETDGGLATFKATHPKWSFVRLGDDGFVKEVAEKRPISNIATVGIYYWRYGSDYVRFARQMVCKNIRTNNEFYVCPVYNEAIAEKKKIKIFPVEAMWGLGTAEDVEYFKRKYHG